MANSIATIVHVEVTAADILEIIKKDFFEGIYRSTLRTNTKENILQKRKITTMVIETATA